MSVKRMYFMSVVRFASILWIVSTCISTIPHNGTKQDNALFNTLESVFRLYPKRTLPNAIKPIKSYHEVDFDAIEPGTLVVFDVDDTLIHPVDTIMNADINKLWQWMIATHPDIHDWDPYWALFIHWSTYEAKRPLIEPFIIHEIDKLKERGIPVIACTFIQTGFHGSQKETNEEWRYNHLKSLGFNGSYDDLILPLSVSEDRNPIFYRGIVTTDKAPKGSSLGAFLDAVNLQPKTVIMFDDRCDFLTSVEEECVSRGIAFQGYKYKGVTKKAVDKELLKFQAHYFAEHKRWLSDEEAYAEIAAIKNALECQESYALSPF